MSVIEKFTRTDFYRIHEVPIGQDGNLYTIDLQIGLLDNGSKKTQDQLAEFSKERLANGDFGYGSIPEIRGLVHKLKLTDDKHTGEIINFLKKAHRGNLLITSTRAIYNPSGEDIIIHNYRLENQKDIKTKLVGSNGPIIGLKDEKVIQAVFDTKDDSLTISEDFKNLNGTETSLWRLNSKPTSKQEKVGGLYAYSGRFYVYCYRNPLSSYSALGARIFAEGEAPKI